MSRLRRALVATTMAAATVGSGLLIAAAGSVPAYAAAPAAPHGSHTFMAPHGSHTYTITAKPTKHAKHATSGVGHHAILPCAEKPGAAIKPAGCLPQQIICWITVGTPFIANYDIMAAAKVHCDNPVTRIGLEEDLIANSQYVVDSSYSPVTGQSDVDTFVESLVCMGGTWTNHANAAITFPDGYTPTFGSVYGNSDLSISVSACTPPPPPSGGGGSGGGGGCAIMAPSLSARPAAIRPHIITCP